MWDELTNVTINDRRGLENLLRAWERVVPVFYRESEHKDETSNKDPGENCPDNSRDSPLWLR